MNWTGGRLQLHSKSNAKKQLNTQKRHFAKARVQSQCGPRITKTHEFALFGSPTDTATNCEVVSDSLEAVDCVGRLHRGADCRSSRYAKGQDQATPKADPAKIFRANNNFEAAKHDLLHRADWLHIDVIRPLCVKFDPPKETQRTARHRRVEQQITMEDRMPQYMATRPDMSLCSPRTPMMKSRARSEAGQEFDRNAVTYVTPETHIRGVPQSSKSILSQSPRRFSITRCEEDSGYLEEHQSQEHSANSTGNIMSNGGNLHTGSNVSQPQGVATSYLGYGNRKSTRSSSMLLHTSHTTSRSVEFALSSGNEFESSCLKSGNSGFNSTDQRKRKSFKSSSTSIHTGFNTNFDASLQYGESPSSDSHLSHDNQNHRSRAEANENVHRNDLEAWIRCALANDFDQVQRDFEFRPSPTRRTKTTSATQKRSLTKWRLAEIVATRLGQRSALRDSTDRSTAPGNALLLRTRTSTPSYEHPPDLSEGTTASRKGLLETTRSARKASNGSLAYLRSDSSFDNVEQIMPRLKTMMPGSTTRSLADLGLSTVKNAQLKRKRSSVASGWGFSEDTNTSDFFQAQPPTPSSVVSLKGLLHEPRNVHTSVFSDSPLDVERQVNHYSALATVPRAFGNSQVGGVTSGHELPPVLESAVPARYYETAISRRAPVTMTASSAERTMLQDSYSSLSNPFINKKARAILRSDLRSSPSVSQGGS